MNTPDVTEVVKELQAAYSYYATQSTSTVLDIELFRMAAIAIESLAAKLAAALEELAQLDKYARELEDAHMGRGWVELKQQLAEARELAIKRGEIQVRLQGEVKDARKQLAERDAEIKALKGFANVMADLIEADWGQDTRVDAYRAAYPEEPKS